MNKIKFARKENDFVSNNNSNKNSKIIKNNSWGNLNSIETNTIKKFNNKKYNKIKKSIDNLKNDSKLKKNQKTTNDNSNTLKNSIIKEKSIIKGKQYNKNNSFDNNSNSKKIKDNSYNNKTNFAVLFLVLILILLSSFAFGIPDSLTLQGKLTSTNGAPLEGSYNVVFRIYDIPGFSFFNVSNRTGDSNTVMVNYTYINYTNVLYKDNRSVITDANGIYNVVLANISLNFSEQYFLGIMVENDNESTPRINLTSSPYSFRANISESLNRKNRYEVSVFNITGNLTVGGSFADVLTVVTGRLNISDGNVILGGNLTLAERISFSLGSVIDNLVSGFLRISGNLNVTGNVSIAADTLFVDNTSGRVGIGTSSPTNLLHLYLNDDTTTSGILIDQDSTGDAILNWDLTGIEGYVACIDNSDSDKFKISDDGGAGCGAGATFLSFDPTGTDTLALMEDGGNVGIGTDSPGAKLEVVGNLSVNGTIRFLGENGSLYQPVYGTDDDLVLYLPFSRGNVSTSNVSVYDRSPFGNDGQCYGTSSTDGCNWTTGKYGNALFFDGVDDNVNINDPNIRNSDFSISAWYKIGRNTGYIYSQSLSSNDEDYIRFKPNQLELRDDAADGRETITISSGAISLNEWHFTVGVWDESAKTGYLYVDGVLAATATDTGFDSISTPDSIFIGDNLDNSGSLHRYFNGTIDEVRIYKRALAAEEIRTHYLRGSGFGASGAITADKFRVVNTSGNVNFIVDNTGNVGIGTSAPTRDLHIEDSTATIFLDTSSTSGTDIEHGTADFRIQHRDNTPFLLFTNNAERMRIDGSGNVGIGTTTPLTLLDIQGTFNASGNASIGDTLYVDNTSSRVGIGTSSPDTILDVEYTANDGTDGLKLGIGGTSQGVIFSDGAMNIGIDNNADSTTNYFRIYNDGSFNNELFRVQEDGNVGIGTTNPAKELVIAGELNVSPSSGTNPGILVQTQGTGITGGATLTLDTVSESGEVWKIISNNADNQGGAGALSIYDDDAGANRLTIDTSGNVGIGTTGPTSLLHVAGTVNITGRLEVNGTLFVNDSRVGIGTSSPSQQLQIVGSVANSDTTQNLLISSPDQGTIALERTTSTVGKWTIRVNPDFNIRDVTNTEDRLIILQSSGNVGIGKTSPNFKLDVDGTINASGLLLTNGSFSVGQGGSIGIGATDPSEALVVLGNISINKSDGSSGSVFIDSTNDAILFTGENGSLYQPVYGTDDGLVLYLPFSRGNVSTSNASVYDRSPYGFDGQCYGTSFVDGCNWTSGKYGNALFFDGLDDYVDLDGHISDFASLDSGTIEIWIKPNDVLDVGLGMIISASDEADATSFLQIFLRHDTDDIRINVRESGTHSIDVTTGTNSVKTNVWTYFAFTVDNSGNSIYINGKKIIPSYSTGSAITQAFFNTVTGLDNLRVGNREINSGQNSYFNGTIDEVRIYSRALTAEEIRTHYLRGSGFGASGAITADKFRVVNTSGGKQLELNQSSFSITNASGDGEIFVVDKENNRVGIGTSSPGDKLEVNGNIWSVAAPLSFESPHKRIEPLEAISTCPTAFESISS